MEHNEFADAVQGIIESNHLDEKIARQLLLAITLDTRERAAERHERVMDELARLGEIVERQAESISQLVAGWEDHQRHHKENPPLVWLLRYRTKETVATMVFIVLVLSAWYASGLREPVLRWLGVVINN